MPELDSSMQGTDLISRSILSLQDFMLGSMQHRLGGMTKYLLNHMRANASLTEHSLQDLRRLGHPYAKRSPQGIHQPSWLVHTQTGDLLRAMGSEKPRRISVTRWESEVYIDTSKAPHAPFVIFGTSTMVPRDFVRETVLQERSNMERGFQVQLSGDFGTWKRTK